MGMAFNNLKKLKLQEITGSQLSQVGDIFTDTSSKSDFNQLSLIKNAILDSKTFTGSLPFPDSLTLFQVIANNATKPVKPSLIYPNELDSDKFMVRIKGFCVAANDILATCTVSLTNGSITIPILTNTRAGDYVELDIEFNENVYLEIEESAGNEVKLIGLYGIISRGGV